MGKVVTKTKVQQDQVRYETQTYTGRETEVIERPVGGQKDTMRNYTLPETGEVESYMGGNLEIKDQGREESKDERFPCKFCGKSLPSGGIFKHESACDKKPKQSANERLGLGNPKPKKVETGEIKPWQKQSNALQEAIKMSRKLKSLQDKGYSGAQIAALVPPIETKPEDDTRVPCPYCNRKFAELTAQRHIPACKNTINKPKPPPTKAQVQNAAQSRSILRK